MKTLRETVQDAYTGFNCGVGFNDDCVWCPKFTINTPPEQRYCRNARDFADQLLPALTPYLATTTPDYTIRKEA